MDHRPRNLSGLCGFVIEAVEAHGVFVSPASRLGRMRAAITGSDRITPRQVPADDPHFEIALEAMRDFQQLGFIFDQLAARQLPPDFRTRLRNLVADVALPQENLTDSKGRDAQCELYVAAICVKAGLTPTFEEPDLRCDLNGQTYGLAIKRIKNYRRFQERIKDAASQIERAGLPGVIVADVSVMLNPDNERIVKLMPDEQFGDVALASMTAFLDAHVPRMVEWTQRKDVRGAFLLDHHVRQHPTDGWGLDSQTHTVNLCPFNQRRRREFDEFAQQFRGGLATPYRPLR
jgi:hypothetical protein